MSRVLRFVGWTVISIALLLAITTTLLWWTNRDLSPGEIEAHYGGENLRRVNLDGVDLTYKVEGSGPPLVLLHSHFYTMRLWQPWVDLLADDPLARRMGRRWPSLTHSPVRVS